MPGTKFLDETGGRRAPQVAGCSLVRKMRDYVVRCKRVFVGLEDAKQTWRLCVRSEGMIIHELSLPREAANLLEYLRGRYPECEVRVMYQAGFHGFGYTTN